MISSAGYFSGGDDADSATAFMLLAQLIFRVPVMPMIPMEPAKEVRLVRAFFVFRLLKLNASAVRKDMDALPIFLCRGFSQVFSSIRRGSESERILPDSQKFR